VVASDVLDRMTDVMTHRGPNDRGTYSADGIALGVRRLSIVDVDGGHQPIANEQGSVWAIQNGELYNHVEIRDRLARAGHAFETRCDTEILPHLYEDAGTQFPQHLRGMFGIAIWDAPRRRAVLARDRLGIKPLYYATVGDLLVFGSELKSVLASGIVPADLDYEAIDAYLRLGFFPTPLTPLERVKKLPPGEVLVVDPDGVRTEAYWKYPQPNPTPTTLSECSARLIDELQTAVRLRLMSDVPLGAMLSGGIDSSLIVSLMARQMSEPVKTFSVGFAEAGNGNELADARFVADYFGTDHHEIELSFRDDAVDLAELVWSLDEPLADLSSLGFLALSKLAAKDVTVALSGQGADELLGGYARYRAASLANHWARLPKPARSAALGIVRRGPKTLRDRARHVAVDDPLLRALDGSGALAPELRAELYRGHLRAVPTDSAERMLSRRLPAIPRGPLSAALYLDAQLGLVDDMLHYFDRASMRHSLEVRVPFLDHHVVEYCATIPTKLKVHHLQTKHVLKVAARGLIPDRIIDKPKVGFFNSAVDDWFRAQAGGPISDYLLAPNPRYADFLDPNTVGKILSEHGTEGKGGADHGYSLLSILMLEIWLASYLPRAVGQPAETREKIRVAS
jgi:asparagine synthase (glutamine-hydrolysing)